jgi:hypothetical protein
VSYGAYVAKGDIAFVIRRTMTLMMKALRYFEMSESVHSATQRIAEEGGHEKPWRTKLISFLFRLGFFYCSHFILPVFVYF